MRSNMEIVERYQRQVISPTTYQFDIDQNVFLSWPEGAKQIIIKNNRVSTYMNRMTQNKISVCLTENYFNALQDIIEASIEEACVNLGRS